jgi:hypothetical protein
VRGQSGRRTAESDTTGPGFGFEQFKVHDFEADKVVLTFDDGLWIGQSVSSRSRRVFRVSTHED